MEIRSLSKRFGPVQAIDGLSFEVRAGSVTGFVGANGAGKTTTLRILLGLAEPDGGEALIESRRYRELAEPLRTVGAVLEAPRFHPARTGRAHLRIQAVLAGVAESSIPEAIAAVDLERAADRPVGGYSLGLRQRLALASALLARPRVLVLDEPTNGLDPIGIRWLRLLLRRLADDGAAVLVSSHVLAELEQVADQFVMLHAGRLVARGSLAELTRQVAVECAAEEPARLAAALAGADWQVDELGDGRLLVRGGSPADVGRIALQSEIALTHLAGRSATLEDVFVEGSAAQRT